MLDKHSLAELADIYKEKYNRLLKDNVELERQIDENNSEIEQLRKERDEARREVCNLIKWDHYGPRHYAQYRKWDCFKGDTDGTE